jgi:hypothetical protein
MISQSTWTVPGRKEKQEKQLGSLLVADNTALMPSRALSPA